MYKKRFLNQKKSITISLAYAHLGAHTKQFTALAVRFLRCGGVTMNGRTTERTHKQTNELTRLIRIARRDLRYSG